MSFSCLTGISHLSPLPERSRESSSDERAGLQGALPFGSSTSSPFPSFPLDEESSVPFDFGPDPFSPSFASLDNERSPALERLVRRRRGSYRKLSPEEKKIRDTALLELAQIRSVYDQKKAQPDSALLEWRQKHSSSLESKSVNCEACKIAPTERMSNLTKRTSIAFCKSCRKLFHTKTHKLNKAYGLKKLDPSLTCADGGSSHRSYPDPSAGCKISSTELSGLESFSSLNPKTPATPGKKRCYRILPRDQKTARDLAISGLVEALLMNPSAREPWVRLWVEMHAGSESGKCMACTTLPATKKYGASRIQKIPLCNTCYRRVADKKTKCKMQSKPEETRLSPTSSFLNALEEPYEPFDNELDMDLKQGEREILDFFD